jgi:hypothetical protein
MVLTTTTKSMPSTSMEHLCYDLMVVSGLDFGQLEWEREGMALPIKLGG